MTSVKRVTDIYPGPNGLQDSLSFRPWHITRYKGGIYLNATDGEHGYALWRYDGNSASLVEQLAPGEVGGYPQWFAEYRGDLYFSAGRNDVGRELFRFDGSAVTLVADIVPGADGSGDPSGLVVVNDVLYFVAETPDQGEELWRFDGNSATLVADLYPGEDSGVRNCCSRFRDEVVFSGRSNSEQGWEPWAFDGTAPRLLADINPDGDSDNTILSSAVFEDTFYFRADDGTHGPELWSYDGDSVALVEDFIPGETGSNPYWFTVFDSRLYFAAIGALGRTLHRYDGTDIEIAAGWPEDPRHLRVFDSKLYFAGGSIVSGVSRELWEFDGTTSLLVKDINQRPASNGGTLPSFPNGLTPTGDGLIVSAVGGDPDDAYGPLGRALYFTASDGLHGFELWRLSHERRLQIDVVVAAEDFDKFWEWPIDRTETLAREVVVATFLTEGDEQRLIQRGRQTIGNILRGTGELHASVSVTDETRSLAVTSVFFDAISGELLAAGSNVIRSNSKEDAAMLESRAAELAKGLTLKQVRSMSISNAKH
ncbi:MAG: hypothetical protein QNJ14_09845 [Woeseiaceae bacterium]|nr:hypothetical protein [Woeseiaceae bacterium]